MDYIQQRDGAGRFTGALVPDGELAAKLAEDTRRAKLAVAVVDRIGLPRELAHIMAGADGEHLWLSGVTKAALRGAMFGLLFAMNHSAEDAARLLADTLDALGMKGALGGTA